MTMNPAFRSHLMQQFAAAAGRQSRPPMVMAQVVARGTEAGVGMAGRPSGGDPSPSSHRSSFPSRASASASTTARAAGRMGPSAGPRMPDRASFRRSTSMAISEVDSSDANISAGEEDEDTHAPSEEAAALQSLIRSRRTVSNFAPAAADPDARSAGRVKSALTRAVRCAVSAPNHHRTEPFTFRRLVSPSDATDRLADIAYRVSVRRMRERARGSEGSILAEAERKREKWRAVPAFLVATVGGQPCQAQGPPAGHGDGDGAGVDARGEADDGPREEEGEGEWSEDDETSDARYAELPLSPPETERQLEDYASAFAAVQNVLLSLHAEGVGSKWATGPVVRTAAFRDLVGAGDDEAVVALVMAGLPKRVPREPRRRRDVEEDVLLDL